jgi:hypothetical protein
MTILEFIPVPSPDGYLLAAGARHFSLLHVVQTDSGAHQASYPMGTEGSFYKGTVAGI